jgi:hypothetical protein
MIKPDRLIPPRPDFRLVDPYYRKSLLKTFVPYEVTALEHDSPFVTNHSSWLLGQHLNYLSIEYADHLITDAASHGHFHAMFRRASNASSVPSDPALDDFFQTVLAELPGVAHVAIELLRDVPGGSSRIALLLKKYHYLPQVRAAAAAANLWNGVANPFVDGQTLLTLARQGDRQALRSLWTLFGNTGAWGRLCSGYLARLDDRERSNAVSFLSAEISARIVSALLRHNFPLSYVTPVLAASEFVPEHVKNLVLFRAAIVKNGPACEYIGKWHAARGDSENAFRVFNAGSGASRFCLARVCEAMLSRSRGALTMSPQMIPGAWDTIVATCDSSAIYRVGMDMIASNERFCLKGGQTGLEILKWAAELGCQEAASEYRARAGEQPPDELLDHEKVA